MTKNAIIYLLVVLGLCVFACLICILSIVGQVYLNFSEQLNGNPVDIAAFDWQLASEGNSRFAAAPVLFNGYLYAAINTQVFGSAASKTGPFTDYCKEERLKYCLVAIDPRTGKVVRGYSLDGEYARGPIVTEDSVAVVGYYEGESRNGNAKLTKVGRNGTAVTADFPGYPSHLISQGGQYYLLTNQQVSDTNYTWGSSRIFTINANSFEDKELLRLPVDTKYPAGMGATTNRFPDANLFVTPQQLILILQTTAYSFNLADMKQQWSYTFSETEKIRSSYFKDDKLILSLYSQIAALDLQGKQLWKTLIPFEKPPKATDSLRRQAAGYVIDKDDLYFTSGHNVSRYNLNTGEIIWTTYVGPDMYNQGNSIMYIYHTPVITTDKVYVSTQYRNFFALDKSNGELMWSQALQTSPSQAIVSNGVIYASGFSGEVFIVEDGTTPKLKELNTGGSGSGYKPLLEGKYIYFTDNFRMLRYTIN